MKLDIKAFAVACAIVWGSGVLLGTWWIILLDGPQDTAVPALGSLYRGFTLTPVGSLIGLAWACVDGFIGGAIFAWLYNKLRAQARSGA